RLRVVPVELRRLGGTLPCPHEDDQERVRIRDEACDLLGNVNVPAVTVNPESGNGGVGRRGGKPVIELASHLQLHLRLSSVADRRVGKECSAQGSPDE